MCIPWSSPLLILSDFDRAWSCGSCQAGWIDGLPAVLMVIYSDIGGFNLGLDQVAARSQTSRLRWRFPLLLMRLTSASSHQALWKSMQIVRSVLCVCVCARACECVILCEYAHAFSTKCLISSRHFKIHMHTVHLRFLYVCFKNFGYIIDLTPLKHTNLSLKYTHTHTHTHTHTQWSTPSEKPHLNLLAKPNLKTNKKWRQK